MIQLREAEKKDASTILHFIQEIAAYEKLSDQVENTIQKVEKSFFGDNPQVFALIVEDDGEQVGFAIYYYTYSTFTGQHGLYLEDFFVKESHRRNGIGKVVFDYLIKKCNENDLTRMEWMVLDWNTPAINFYAKYEPRAMSEWIYMRLGQEELRKIGNES